MIKDKGFLILLCLIIFVISIAGVSANDINQTADILEVSGGEDILEVSDSSDEVLGDAPGNFTELKSLIDSGDYVVLEKDYTRDPSERAISLQNRPLTIVGNGHVLNANGLRVFQFYTTSKVILENITFTGAKSSAIYSQHSSDFEIINCTFRDNSLSSSGSNQVGGAAIRFDSYAKCKIINSTFINNTYYHPSNSGGGGAIFAYSAFSLEVDNTKFINNSASNNGGVFYTVTQIENSIFTNVTFENNHAGEDGGVLMQYWYTDATKYPNKNVSFTDVYFINNTAGELGGSLYFVLGTDGFVFNRVNFINNSASRGGAITLGSSNRGSTKNINTNFTNVNFTGNRANTGNSQDGGVFYTTTGDTSNYHFKDCIFDNNSAVSGACFYFWGDAIDNTFENVNFTNCHASSSGGVFHFIHDGKGLVFNQSTFINNSAGYGGGVFSKGYYSTYEYGDYNTYFYNNKIIDCNFNNNSAAMGGVLFTDYGSKTTFQSVHVDNIIFDGVNFTNNKANYGDGGVMYFRGTSTRINVSNSNFVNSTVHSRVGYDADGGAIAFYSSTKNSIFNNVNFTNSSAERYGGTIHFESNRGLSSNVSFINVNFENSKAGNAGGAVYICASNSTFNKTTFENNSAGNGGAVYIYGSGNSFDECEFNNNEAGGGVSSAIATNNGNVNIYNSNFTNNSGGNSVVSTYDNSQISNSRFFNNSAESETVNHVGKSSGTSLSISDTIFENNTGKQTNVVKSQSSAVNVINSNFTDNSGRALLITDGDYSTIENSTFTNHVVDGDGAAVSLINTNAYISGSHFKNNNASGYGGAVYAMGSDLNIDKSTFKNNTALRGGAVSVSGADGVSVKDSAFFNNSASYGSAIYFDGVDSADVSDSNFSDNYVTKLDLKLYPNNYEMSVLAFLTGGNTQINAIYSDSDMVSYSNVWYLSDEGMLNTDINRSLYVVGAHYQNVTVLIYSKKTGQLVRNITNLTDENAYAVFRDLGIEPGNYTIFAYHPETSTYPYAECYSEFREIGNFTALQILVNMTENGGTLVLPQDFTYTIGLDEDVVGFSGVFIDKNITIDGNGHFIDALGISRIFDIEGQEYWDPETQSYVIVPMSVKLTNITFVNGYQLGDGGAIHAWSLNNMSIEYCKFLNNSAEGQYIMYSWYEVLTDARGGAVYLSNIYNSTITDCEFVNNNVSGTGYGWTYGDIDGGALYISGVNNTIKNSIFENNSALGDSNPYGGAISGYFENSTMNNLTFINNFANKSGGALFVYSFGSIFEDSTFENNRADGSDSNGGAFYIDSAEDTTFRNLTFTNNSAITGGAMYISYSMNSIIEDSTFENNTAYVNDSDIFTAGGAIYAYSYSLSVKNSTFKDNNASAGGAIYFDVPEVYDWSDDFINNTIEDSIFISNSARYSAGAVYYGEGDNLTVLNSKFINNTAGEDAGAIEFIESGYSTISGSEFTGNTAYMDDSMGGALFFDNSWNINITDSLFEFNRAGWGSAISIMSSDNYTFARNTFRDNKANSSVLDTGEFGEKQWAVAALWGNDNYANAIYSSDIMGNIIFDSVNYWAFPAMASSNDIEVEYSEMEIGQLIVFEFYDENNKLVKNASSRTNLSGIAKMPYYDLYPGEYTVRFYHPDDSYYTYIEGENITINVPDNGWGDFAILQKLIDDLEDGQTLLLSRNFTYTIGVDNITNGIEINGRNISIEGNGFTVNALNQSRIFNITDSEVLIKDIVLSNATPIDPEVNGGAVYIKDSDVIIENAEFADNKAADGASVYVESGKLNMSDSITGDANAIYNNGEAILTNITENAQNSGYAVCNNKTLSLEKNEFDNLIIDMGNIITQTTVNVMGNQSITSYESSYTLTALVTDDNGNIIQLMVFNFVDEDDLGAADFNGTHYCFDYNDIALGIHVITAAFEGLDNVTVKTSTLTVRQNTTIEISIEQINNNEKAIITATVSPAVTGNVTFMVNNIIYSREIDEDGVATLTLENLNAGKYNVLAVYPGEEFIGSSSDNTSFRVIRMPTEIIITVENDDRAVIKANVTEGATGTVTFIVDGVSYTRNIGEALELDKFGVGNHSISAIYNGDKLYKSSSNDTVYVVNKMDSLVKVSGKSVSYGNNAVITVTVPKAQTGTVTITVNGEDYTKVIDNGKAVFEISGLVVNTYPVDVVYNGNENYSTNTNSSSFKITKATLDASVKALNVTTAQNASFVISVPDDFTGKVKITVDGVTYDGEAKSLIQMVNLTAGDKKATVKFYNDPNYKDLTLTAEFTVTDDIIPVVKNASNIKVEVKNDKIIASVENGAQGDVIFNVNGKEYTVPIKNGKATLEDALAIGDNSIVAYYPENDEFNSSIASTTYNKAKLESLVKVTGKSIAYGSDEVITVTVPKAQTGTVTITVGGKTYTEIIDNGKATFTISGLAVNNYEVDVTYDGDDIYASNINSSSFKVTKADLDACVDAFDVTELQNTSFAVTVPDDFAGKVKITVDGVTYDGEAKSLITMANLTAGDKKATVKFYGDSNYKDLTLTAEFTVTEVEKPVVKNASNIKVEVKNDKIIASVENGAQGDVIINVNGKEYTVPIKNGKATLENALAIGDNSIVATYPENDEFNSSIASTTYNKAKLESLVKVTGKSIAYGNDEVITVTVPKAQTGTVTITVGGKTYTEIIDNGKATFTISGLAVNNYEVDVTYDGDDIYASNINSSSFKVTKADLDACVDAFDVTELQNTSFAVTVPDDFAGKVKITVDGVTYDGEAKSLITMANLTAGDKKATVKFYGDSNYKDLTLTAEFTVSEVEKPVVKNASNIKVEVKNDKIIASVENGAQGDVIINVNGKEYTVPIKNGKATLENALTVGNNSIVAFYPENDNYNSSIDSVNYIMDKLASSVKVLAKDIVYGNDATITVEVPKAQTGTVTIAVDGKTYTEIINNGKATFTVSGLAVNSYKVDVTYDGDKTYKALSNSSSFKVKKADLNAEASALNVTTQQNTSFIIDVPDDFTGKVKITVDGITYDGEAKSLIQMANLTKGDKKATVRFYNDANYNDLTLTCEFEVTEKTVPVIKKDANVTISIKDDSVTVDVPDDATGDVVIFVNDDKYTVPVKNGKAVLNDIPFKDGNNTVTVIYSGDDNYNLAHADKNILINNNKVVAISVGDVTKYFSGPERFTVNVTYDDGTPIPGVEVVITINGIDYDRATNTDGVASFPLNLNSGNYTVDVKVEKFEFSSTNHVEILPTIYATDVTKVFRNGTQYYALFLDGEGNPLVKTQVSFNIHGVFYNRTTNASGWAKLNLNLEKGEYILTAINPVTDEMRTNIVTVISQLETKDLVKYYRNESQFVVRVVADDGSYAGAGEEVTFNIHGMIYTRVTNETGHAKLNINIEPGNYTITTYYKECREGNTITVLPTLSAEDLSMKYMDGSKFTAKVLDGNGKPYPSQKVKFNINGVFYDRTTDSQGLAKLNIRLQEGEYLITSQYNNAKISNTITVGA